MYSVVPWLPVLARNIEILKVSRALEQGSRYREPCLALIVWRTFPNSDIPAPSALICVVKACDAICYVLIWKRVCDQATPKSPKKVDTFVGTSRVTLAPLSMFSSPPLLLFSTDLHFAWAMLFEIG